MSTQVDQTNQIEEQTAGAEPVALDPARQQTAREYAAIQRRLSFVELGLTGVILLVLLFTGWSAGLRNWAEGISSQDWLVVALYGVALGLIFAVITFPIDFYSGYVLPRRYGLLTQSLGGWTLDTV